jgi:hypothetical protein
MYNGSEGKNQFGAQCVNTWGEFLAEAGLPQLPGNAATINYSPYGQFIQNKPDNAPLAGDFVVFKGGKFDAVNGHAALALHNSSHHLMHLEWQNDPDGSPEQMLYMNYDNCEGWWRVDWVHHGVQLVY